MIKCSKSTLNFTNTEKLIQLHSFIDEYKIIVSKFIDILWLEDKIPKKLPKYFTDQITDTWLSARAIQCAGKQASGIVRGTRKKQEQRLFIINQLVEQKKFKKARKLQRIYDETSISKPDIKNIEPELDSRFVEMDFNSDTSFDGWITLASLGNKLKIQIPFKKHKHFNKLSSIEGSKLKKGIRLSKKNITFNFDLPDPKLKSNGKILGVDIGQNSTLTCSNGQVIDKDNHSHNYISICKKLFNKKKGSKAFNKTVKHRTNYLRWCVKQLNLDNIKTVNSENIKYLRKGKICSKDLKHWNYAELFDVLESFLADTGVQSVKVRPTYTSQRCSECGWVCKKNRKGKQFKCTKCNHTSDADLNASINISLPLIPISKQQRLNKENKTGFYWKCLSQESIVPDTLKININDILH